MKTRTFLKLFVAFAAFVFFGNMVAFGQSIKTNSRDLNNITVTVETTRDDFYVSEVDPSQSLYSVNLRRPSGREGTGYPALPVVRLFIAVGNAEYTVSGGKDSVETPVAGVYTLAGEPELTVEQETPTYRPIQFNHVNAYANTVTIGEKIHLGHLAVIPVDVRPFSYDAFSGKLRVRERIIFTLNATRYVDKYHFDGKLNRLDRLQIHQLVANGSQALDALPASQVGEGGFLIMTSPAFAEAANILRSHYQTKGQRVFTAIIEDSETSVTKVAKTIKEAYREHQVDSVLFLGDQNIIPLASMSSTLGDTKYALMDSDGYLDIAIGRLPASTPEEALHYVKKTVRYQELKSSGHENKKVILAAHREEYPGKYTANMERVRKGPNARDLDFLPVYGGNGGLNEDVVDAINAGAGLVTYRGHGSYEAWSSWAKDGSFSKRDMSSLTNEDLDMTIVLNIACNNGGIQKNYPVLVENLLNYQVRGNELSGVVGTLGATKPSYTVVNHDYAEYLFQQISDQEEPSMGTVNVVANNALTRDRNGMMNKNTKMYVLFSDPQLQFAIGD